VFAHIGAVEVHNRVVGPFSMGPDRGSKAGLLAVPRHPAGEERQLRPISDIALPVSAAPTLKGVFA